MGKEVTKNLLSCNIVTLFHDPHEIEIPKKVDAGQRLLFLHYYDVYIS